MPILSSVLRVILSDPSDYCCLCFNRIGETGTAFSIEDEVSLGIDIEQTEVLYEIIYTVLGDKVLHNISALKVICQKCTGIVINCYKFIQQCQQNIKQLCSTIDSLQKHSQIVGAGNCDYKSIFVALNTSNNDVELYFDKHQNCDDQILLHKKFERLYKNALELDIDIELESNCRDDNKISAVKKRKQCRAMQSVILADIVCDEDALNNLKCKTCSKKFPTVIKMKHHYQRVHAPKDFQCSQCPRSFGTPFLLKRHTKDSHTTAVCSQCGRTFTNLYTLRRHEQSHQWAGLICQKCGKIYKGKKAFNNHIEKKLCEKMRKSNAESQFTCDYCGKKYAHKSGLSTHIREEHGNGTVLICDWCGKKCSAMSRLKEHIIKHTKQKNFECYHCGGKFVTKTSLLYHTRTHTGEKPYKCEYCNMSFLSASRRSEHVKRHHRQAYLECEICNDKFKSNFSLHRHKKKHFDSRIRNYCNT